MSFQPTAVRCFRFTAYDFDATLGRVRLHYALDEDWHFCEELWFPGADLPLSPDRAAALDRVLHALHLVAGISYYKTAIPPEIRVETRLPDAASAAFLGRLYRHGLGEFAYQNQLDLRQRCQFPAGADWPDAPVLPLPHRSIVPVGGGKDSIVALETLRQRGEPLTLFSVGQARIIREVVAVADLPYLTVERRLSPQLFALNQAGAYNGHVPISAIIAYILAAAAILYGFDRVVMANERSANVGNLGEGETEVNHQYSKSLAFEQGVQAEFAKLLPGFQYFSLLRPLSELEIARRFAALPAYHGVFSSCNANYKIHPDARLTTRWCLDCPKCRFVFLALAPFLEKSQLLAIFGKNLLADPQQQAGFDALIGVDAHKPFECVGEVEESLAAFYLLSQQAAWQDDLLVARFRRELLARVPDPAALVQAALTPSAAHAVPEACLSWLT